MRHQHRRFFAIIIIFSIIACCTPPAPRIADIGSTPLKTKYDSATYFTIGAAVGPAHLTSVDNILEFHFNRLTCENAMKWSAIHPSEGTYNFTEADAVANYARANGMKMTGHTLIWHNQCPAWVFQNLGADPVATLKARMKSHIDTVVARYYDVIDNWDVVNEAVNDDGTYRASNWYTNFGSEAYIYWAFKYAKDKMDELGSSAGKLYYNDYSVENATKRAKILAMADWLKTGAGGAAIPGTITIDGIGSQAHWNISWPSANTIKTTINDIRTAGYNVKFSELDISIYTSSGEAQKVFTPALEQQQAAQYDAIFGVFRDPGYEPYITSVTLWGVSDDRTWLDNFPVAGRNDSPLLFNDLHDAKLAYDEIINF